MGGSVGIALVTTSLARRAQFHQSVLVTHLTSGDPAWQTAAAAATERLVAFGYTTVDAAARAPAAIAATLQQQATLLGALDCFWLLAALSMIGPALAIWIRPFDQTGAGRTRGH